MRDETPVGEIPPDSAPPSPMSEADAMADMPDETETPAQKGKGGRRAAKEKKVDWGLFQGLMRQYAIIHGTTTVFCRKTKTIMTKEAARLLHSRMEWNLWVDSLDKDVVMPSDVVFDPTGKADEEPQKCNMYIQQRPTPREGLAPPSPWLDLLDWLISVATETVEEEQALRHWLICWYAYPIKYPGAKLRTAIVYQGDEGAGKNLLHDCICDLYGQYAAIVGQDELEDSYNDWRDKKQFVVGDEVVSAQELGHTKNRLKNLITSPTVMINPKGLPRRPQQNLMNIVFLSNEVRPLKLDNTDRRYCVVWTPPRREQDFYRRVADWRNAGGVEELHRYFLDYDLQGFDPFSAPPMTRAKVRLIDLSRSSSEQFLIEWSQGETPYPFVSGGKQQVFDAYRRWCQKTGQRFTQDLGVFTRQVARLAESNDLPVREWRGEVGSLVSSKTKRMWKVGDRPEQFGTDREWMNWCEGEWFAALKKGSDDVGGSFDAPM